MNLRFLAIICTLPFLTSCTSFFGPKPPDPVIVKVQPSKIKIPTFQPPEKSLLDPVKFDWPRSSSLYSIKNTRTCLDSYKKLYQAKALPILITEIKHTPPIDKFWANCGVKAIDLESNLYIGLDLENYKNLVNNQKMLMQREKRWLNLLRNINQMIKDLNPPPIGSTKKK